MTESAVLLANGHFDTVFAKTTHGLVRGPSRYAIRAVVDPSCAGADAGERLDGIGRDIPILSSVAALDVPLPTHCVVGVATEGGFLPDELRGELLLAAERGMTLVNGLHQLLEADPEIAGAVARGGGAIIDLRKPRPVSELRFWTGEIAELTIPRIAVLGTDCALGKRTTTMLLREALRERGVGAEVCYTGQTGWLQGLDFGFILDATPNDFVSGELEGAVLRCARDASPDVILLEGQSALRNPSGPCGAELLVSARASGVVLVHASGRVHFDGFGPEAGEIPPIDEELELIRLYGSELWGVALNERDSNPVDLVEERDRLREKYAIPVVNPLSEGVALLADDLAARLRA